MDKWLVELLRTILTAASPGIRDLMQQMALDFKKQADKTDNQFDDLLADILLWFSGAD